MADFTLKATPVAQNEKGMVYAGIVKGVDSRDDVTNVKLNCRYYDKKEEMDKYQTISIAFWKNEGFDAKAIVDRVKLKEGQFVMVACQKNKKGNLVGSRVVKGSGIITLKGEPYDTNVLMGSVVAVKYNGERGVTNATMLVNGKVAEGKYDTINARVAVWNTEKRKNAEKAAEILSPKDGVYPRIVAVTGTAEEVSEFTRKNGEVGYGQIFGGNTYFQFVPVKKEKSDDEEFQPVNEDDMPDFMK